MKWMLGIGFLTVFFLACLFLSLFQITGRGTAVIPPEGKDSPEKMFFYDSLNGEVKEADCLEGLVRVAYPFSDLIIGVGPDCIISYRFCEIERAFVPDGPLDIADIKDMPMPLADKVLAYLSKEGEL